MSVSSTDLFRRIDRPRDASRVLGRLVLMVVGVALACSAFGLWVVPGTRTLPELMLMKLGLSLFLLIAGLCCLSASRSRD